MNVEFVEIANIGIPIIIPFLIIFSITFIVGIYLIFDGKLKSNVIFDIGFLCVIGGVVLSRFFGVINDIEWYLDLDWQLLPFSDSTSGIEFITSMPWQLVNIFDQNFLLLGMPIGIIISGAILYISSNKKQNVTIFIDKIVMALLPARILLSIGNYVSTGYIDSNNNFYQQTLGDFYSSSSFINLALIEIIIFLIGLLIIALINQKTKKEGFILGSYLVLEGIIAMAILTQLTLVNPIFGISWVLVLGIVIVLLGLLIIFQGTVKNLFKKNNVKEKRRYLTGENLIRRKPVSDIEIASDNKALKNKLKSYLRWKK